MGSSEDVLRSIALLIESEQFESVQIDPRLLREIADELVELKTRVENLDATVKFLEQVAQF